ncbi:MAG: alpha/beta hydrolase [Bacteroidia bacterium]
MKKYFLLLLLACSAYGNAQTTKPFVIGEIAEIPSRVLSEKRILNIYLPEGYDAKDTVKYPVIYLLDGSADEDFIHIAGLVQFCNFSWVNTLPRSIVVGIANVDRKRDFTFPTTIAADKKDFPTTGGSAKFIEFVETELLPYIDRNYRTNSQRMLIGQSLGGLVATEILFKKPSLFTKYLIVSPSLWWDNGSLLNTMPDLSSRKNISVFVAVGKEEDVMMKQAKQLHEMLEKQKLESSFLFLPDLDHATILHEAVYKGFEHWKLK